MTDRYAVIGNPIGHTKSPMIHAAFARQTGQDIAYVALEAPVDGFSAKVDAFRAAGGRGINVTAPFKLAAAAYATRLLESARIAGAVNAIAFDGAEAIADNFDGAGLVRDVTCNLGVMVRGRRVLLLGAGGATRGALLPFIEQAPAGITVANRTRAKAGALGAAFAPFAAVRAAGFEDLVRMGGYDIVVNATSSSLQGESLPIRSNLFAGCSLAYDLTYGKGLTPFLRLAQEAGVPRLADGVGMLVEQAAAAFAWWRGVRPDTRPVIELLTVPLT